MNNIFRNEIVDRRSPEPSEMRLGFGQCYHLTSLIQKVDFEDEPTVRGEIIRLALLLYNLHLWGFMTGMTAEIYQGRPQHTKLRVIMEKNEIRWGRIISLKAWVVVMGFLNAIQDTDVRFWTNLWIQTLDELKQ